MCSAAGEVLTEEPDIVVESTISNADEQSMPEESSEGEKTKIREVPLKPKLPLKSKSSMKTERKKRSIIRKSSASLLRAKTPDEVIENAEDTSKQEYETDDEMDDLDDLELSDFSD